VEEDFRTLTLFIVILSNGVDMHPMKNAIDFIMRHILRIGRAKHGGEQFVDNIDSDAAPSTVTLRTYSPGGDPFEDRIEFHLTKNPSTPNGFREPKEP
jgi:hypothetical protein